MLRAVSRNPSRNDLPAFCNEISKDSRIPIVDIQFFIGAESADLSPQERFLLPVGGWPLSRSLHFLLPSLTELISPLARQVVSFDSSKVSSSMAITSVRVRFLPSGVCQCR